MDQKQTECVCGQKVESSPDGSKPLKCSACGRDLSVRPNESMGLSDSAIDATCEIMAEEGAIWSGAR
ncbi:MAG: hypothetical protein CVU57_30940 [Deltaproteobacteria bacterium HGW-Deltaproteobacteria-15]|jgi:hypothetical protein|nr:MAG: hypothetical protein CVU57_30940 [Deltaproteobacteria bacterium HGW-Deltaproteobacteria-15]